MRESTLVVATAFTAGIILVNLMSEESPRGKEGRLRYFLLGVGVFAVVSILIPRTGFGTRPGLTPIPTESPSAR